MSNFEYFAPTKVFFGKETQKLVSKLIADFGYKNVLIHFGSDRMLGLVKQIKSELENFSIKAVTLGGVIPNPVLSLVRTGIKIAKENNVDFILAIGGGSVIDSAKAIALGAVNECDVWDFYNNLAKAKAALPIGCILSIAAAGSEMSYASVILNEETKDKRVYNDNLTRPVFACMNPEFQMTLSKYQTMCGCVDILMHTMERYFTKGENMELTDAIAEALMRVVIKNALILNENLNDYNARAEIMWASSLSHNGLTGCGNGGDDFVTHLLEHEITGLYGVAHGAGLSAIWGSWARYVYKEIPQRFINFAKNVMNIQNSSNDENTILLGIEAIEDFFRKIQMPTNFKELLGFNPSDDDILLMTKKCVLATGGCKGSAKKIYENDMLEIYKMARK